MAKDNDRNIRLRENYQKLVNAGFSSKDATRLRGAGAAKLNAALTRGVLPPVDPVKQAAGAGKTKETVKPEIIKTFTKKLKEWTKAAKKELPPGMQEIPGKIVYQEAGKNDIYKYLSKYTYQVAYQVKHKDGSKEWKVINLTSPKKLYKYQIREEVINDIFNNPKNLIRYDSVPVIGSITLIGAYEKTGPYENEN